VEEQIMPKKNAERELTATWTFPAPPDDEGKQRPMMNGSAPLTLRALLCPMLEQGILQKQDGHGVVKTIALEEMDRAIDVALRLRTDDPLELSTDETVLVMKLINHEDSGVYTWLKQMIRGVISPADIPENYRPRVLKALAKPLIVTLPGSLDEVELHMADVWKAWKKAEKAWDLRIKEHMKLHKGVSRARAAEELYTELEKEKNDRVSDMVEGASLQSPEDFDPAKAS
jgi:hypothetical protein